MSQEIPPGDILFGAVVLLVFLTCALVTGRMLSRVRNARFARAWAPLRPLVDGRVAADGGGAATSRLTGTYRDHPVEASMIPHRNRYSGESGYAYNCFEVALLDIPGAHSWRLSYATPTLGIGRSGWQIVADDPAVEARLQASDLIARVAPFGPLEVVYRSPGGRLHYRADVTPALVPTPERLLAELELLLALAAINAVANGG